MWQEHAWAQHAWAEYAWLGLILEESIKFGAEIFIPAHIRDIAMPAQLARIDIMGTVRKFHVPPTITEIEIDQ